MHFWATVCKMVRPVLSDNCPVLSVCDVRILWQNDQMDQNETWHGGRPRPWQYCVKWRPSSHCPKGAQSPNFRSMSIVAKQLDASGYHLVRR